MKFTLSTALCTILLFYAAVGQGKPPDPAKPAPTAKADAEKPAPVVTAEQKLQVKDFQLVDSNLQVSLMSIQQQKTENQQRAGAYIGTLCKSTDGKEYYLKLPDLVCAPVSKPK